MKRISYIQLVKRIKETLRAGRRAIRRIKAATYWQTGKWIDEHIRSRGGKAGYAENVIHRLAADLKTNPTHLYHALEFYRAYPIFPARGKLSWTHYKRLLSVNDPNKRKQLAQKSIKYNWSSRELAAVIKKSRKVKKGKARVRLLPKRGKVGVFSIARWDGDWVRDLGFSNYEVLASYSAKQKRDQKKIKPSDLFTYNVKLERVVDADTLWVRVHLKGLWYTRQKLRLRGVNAPELTTKRGQRAKAFLEDYFKDTREFVIRSSKSDKYDRYLADVFVGQIYLNNYLVNEGYAKYV